MPYFAINIYFKLIFSSLLGLALIAFTGCTTGGDVEAGAKFQSDK